MKKLTVLLVGLIVVALALPASAEIKVGGKVWLQTGMNTETKNIGLANEYNQTDTLNKISGLSRLIFKLGPATLEIRPSGTLDIKTTGIEDLTTKSVVHKLYGTANFAGGEVLVGLDESIFDDTWGRTVWHNTPLLIGWGKFWGGRIGQIRYTKKAGDLGVRAALATPSGGLSDLTQSATLPRIEGEVSYKLDKHVVAASVLMETTKAYKEVTGKTKDFSGSAYALAVVAKIALDPANITATVHTGQNLGSISKLSCQYAGKYDATKNDIVNATGMGYYLDGEVKVADNLSVGFGYAADTSKRDGAADLERLTYFADLRCKINPNLTLSAGYNALEAKSGATKTAIKSGLNIFTTISF